MPAAPCRANRRQAAFVEQAQTSQIPGAGVGLSHIRADLHQPGECVFSWRSDAHGVGRVHKQRATDRHLTLKILGNQAITTRGDFPSNGLGRIAGPIVTQVEQLTAGPGAAEPMHSRWRQ